MNTRYCVWGLIYVYTHCCYTRYHLVTSQCDSRRSCSRWVIFVRRWALLCAPICAGRVVLQTLIKLHHGPSSPPSACQVSNLGIFKWLLPSIGWNFIIGVSQVMSGLRTLLRRCCTFLVVQCYWCGIMTS